MKTSIYFIILNNFCDTNIPTTLLVEFNRNLDVCNNIFVIF